MTDDNAKKAVRMLKSRPEAAALIERTLVKKWGELTGGDFSRAILAISPQIINAVYDEINEVFSDMRETANEHVNRGRWQAADKLVEVLYYRAFLAHLVNRVKDVEETAENFYQEYNKILPYLEKEMQKRPDDYLLRELDIYRNLTLPEVVALWNRKEATGQESRMLMAAIRAADIDANERKPQEQIIGGGVPKNFYAPNSVFANALRAIDGKGELIGAGPVDLPVMNIGRPNEITMFVEAWTDAGYTLTTEKPYTAYNESVLNGVISLYVDRVRRNLAPIITAADVYRTINDMAPGATVNSTQSAAVTKSLNKLNSIWASIDATDQIKKKKATTPDGRPIESFKLRDRLLNFKTVEVKISGKKQVGYIISEPITYTHAHLTGQVVSFPTALLDIKETRRTAAGLEVLGASIKNSETRIAVKMYVIKRVEIMRRDEEKAIDARRKEVRKCEYENKKGTPSKPRPIAAHRKQSRVILFDTLFAAAEITSKSRKTEYKKYVFDVLDYLEAMGRIKKWTERKAKKGTSAAVEITV